jgi:lysophospholipase L1-like esterase
MVMWPVGVLAALVAAIVVAEFAARWALWRGGRYLVNLPGTRTVLNLEPAVSPHLESPVRIEVNAFGERGSELPAGAGDVLRVAVVGGSAAYCYLVDQPHSWPQKMGTCLASLGAATRLGRSRVHVGNLSEAELSSGGARLIVERALPNCAGLDAVVLMIGISDMLRWLRYGAPDRLPAQTAAEVFAVQPEGPYSWRPRASALAEVGRRIRHRWTLWRQPVVHRKKVGTSVINSRMRKRNATRVIVDVPDPASMLAEYRANLAGIIEALVARQLAVVVLGQPHYDSTGCSDFVASQFWNGGIGDPSKEPVTVFYSNGVLDELSRQVNIVTREVAERAGVPYVHLDAIVPSDLKYYYDQFHFTPAGSDIVARAAAEALGRALARPAPAPAAGR